MTGTNRTTTTVSADEYEYEEWYDAEDEYF